MPTRAPREKHGLFRTKGAGNQKASERIGVERHPWSRPRRALKLAAVNGLFEGRI
jgi:hypothetical protein